MKNCTPETLQEQIAATVPKKQAKPVEHMVMELYQCGLIFETEGHHFRAKGLSQAFLDCANALAQELKSREEVWVSDRFDKPAAQQQWKAVQESAYSLRKELAEDLALALLDHYEAEQSLKEIRKGKGDADLLLDLSSLIGVARKYGSAVEAAGISQEYLNTAEKRTAELANLYAEAKIATDQTRALKHARNQSKQFAHEYLKLIRKYASVIYRDQPEKRQLFVSSYKQENNRNYRLSKSKKSLPAS